MMHVQTKHKHMIDFLFPVVLFFVFTLSALTVILLAANIYRSTIDDSSRNNTARTSLAYISEKIHQYDSKDSVSLGTFDGCDALVLKQQHDTSVYCTYIYVHEGALKEILIKEGTAENASGGKAILEIKDFSMEALENNLFKFDCTDNNGRNASVIVAVRSDQDI